jgi:hypothetical protein
VLQCWLNFNTITKHPLIVLSTIPPTLVPLVLNCRATQPNEALVLRAGNSSVWFELNYSNRSLSYSARMDLDQTSVAVALSSIWWSMYE